MKRKHSSSRQRLKWVHVPASDPVSSDPSTSVTVKRRVIPAGPRDPP